MEKLVPKNKLFEWFIRVKSINGSNSYDFSSLSIAMQELNLKDKSTGTINLCILGYRHHAYGYIWKRLTREFTILPGEEFRYCKGFHNLYAVSNLGRVISMQFHNTEGCKVLKLSSNSSGYLFAKMRIWKENYVKSYPVHRLVAEAFLDNPENKPYIDYIDTIPSNNLLSNLRWVTPLENQNNPKTLKRLQDSLTRYNRSLKHKYQVQNAMGKAVTLLNINKDFIKDYPTLNEAALDLSTSIGTINRRCKNGNIFRGKYYLKFKEYAEKS